jgi:hypothetical protein
MAGENYYDFNTANFAIPVTVRVSDAVKVFGCQLKMPAPSLEYPYKKPDFAPSFGTAKLSFIVFRNNFGKIRTVCYGIFERNEFEDDFNFDFGKRIEFSGVARLNSEHMEEFNVEIGIRQSFKKALDSLLYDRRYYYGNTRNYRKQVWDRFNEMLLACFDVTEDYPFGVWYPNWTDDLVVVENDDVVFLVEDFLGDIPCP